MSDESTLEIAHKRINKPNDARISFQDFIASRGPNKLFAISDLGKAFSNSSPLLNPEDVQLFCDGRCNGVRSFRRADDSVFLYTTGSWKWTWLKYVCRNCQETTKLLAIGAALTKEKARGYYAGDAMKLGEFPAFGPQTPARLLRLIQSDREQFLLGRRAETQGMGIGAFAYYRRVVENQKGRLFDRAIDVATKLGVPQDRIDKLIEDRDKWNFKQSEESLRGVMPPELLINGHSPLALLHRALSEGLHSDSDAGCLELAETIRLVLIEFADRCSDILKERSELHSAISRLLAPPPEEPPAAAGQS